MTHRLTADKKNAGYSLAELAIVITVIGLLVAIVTTGMSMRRTSELHGMLYSIQQYQAAQETFYSKYEDLPGDMTDAFDYWGSACDATEGNCNGDGDGDIELSGTGDDNEVYRLWQHLVLSQLLDEGFDGEGNGTGDQADPGVNVPVSARTKVGFVIVYGNIDSGTDRNEIRIGAFQADAALGNSALSPKEALALDKKTDDGVPATGQTFGADGADATANECVTAGGAYNAGGGDNHACILSFPIERR